MFSSSKNSLVELPGFLAPLKELENFANIRLVAFDLDGTLLRAPDSTPGERFQLLQNSAASFGVRITLATGRTLTGASRTLSALQRRSATPVILYNGSLVIDPSNWAIVSHMQIGGDVVKHIIALAEENKASCFVYTVQEQFGQNILDTSLLSKLEQVWHWGTDRPSVDFNGMPILEGASNYPNLPATAALILPSAQTSLSKLEDDLRKVDEISITSSGSKYIEIRPFGASKAEGMTALCRAINVERAHTLAVGDNDNDVELLRWAKIGVAIKGATESALGAADYVTRFGAERGAIEVLDLIRKTKRLMRSRTHASK